jgi:DNA polymerase type B, organellar and viral
MLIMTGKLDDLGKCLCPELGGKGSFDHEGVSIENLDEKREEYISYLDRDILLLGAIMQKAQEIYISTYGIDVTRVLTISSMALAGRG